jgi:hypothetical protein
MLQILAALVIGAAIFFGVKYVLDLRSENSQLKATVDQQGQTATAAGTITGATGSALDDRQRLDIVVTQAGVKYAQQYGELKREDENVRGWADGVVPVSVRNLARQRRLARDRSRGAALGGEGTGAATGTARASSTP